MLSRNTRITNPSISCHSILNIDKPKFDYSLNSSKLIYNRSKDNKKCWINTGALISIIKPHIVSVNVRRTEENLLTCGVFATPIQITENCYQKINEVNDLFKTNIKIYLQIDFDAILEMNFLSITFIYYLFTNSSKFTWAYSCVQCKQYN